MKRPSQILAAINFVMEPSDVMLTIRRGEEIADLSKKLILSLQMYSSDDDGLVDDITATRTIILILNFLFNSKGDTYVRDTEDYDAVIDLFHAIVREFSAS
jgi:hypothetical protein